ncbi:MAG: hypothetical protein JST12_12385 [Armatimonadetes bacterium]|nr:hypothetical protein [Armatimonadota bacterium]MBS1725882.1 hypothetical protein [Armatimonadota bacterium]
MKIISISALALAFGLMVPSLALAQDNPFFGGGSTSSSGSDNWKDIKLNPKTKIKLDFHSANVDYVISIFQKTSGINIVKDPSLTGGITLTSASEVPLKTGFQILEKTLNLKGYDLKKDGDLLVIQKQQTRDRGDRGNSGFQFDPSMFQNMNQNNSVLKIYPIQYANATQVARVVNDVFQASGQQQNPFQAMFQRGGGGGRGGNRFGGGGFNFGGFNPFGNNNQGSNIRASADDFSNSVIVNAPDKEQKEVERVIRTIDKQTDDPQHTKVYKLEYATATDVASTIQNVLTNNAPRGKGGVTSSGSNFQDRFQQAIRFGSTQASFGTVAADSRTNSLVVTATDENQLVVQSVIKDLDKPVDFESTTFVFPLNNAKADDVAQLINNAFGQRQGVNGRTNRTANTGNNRQTTNNNNRNNNNRNLGGSIDNPNDPKNMYLQMEDQNATDGELLTSVSATQGFQFRGGFGGGNSAQNQSTQTGRTPDGRLVPVQDLTGQVTTIADPNTNSIIVVANPDYAALIKQILEQLDKIPEQVMIETTIVEANLDASDKLGIEWNYLDNAHLGVSGQQGNIGTTFGLGTSTTNPAQGFKYTIGGKNLTSFMNAIQSDTKFNILSTPRIFTSNNTQAEINISQSIPYVTSSRTDNNGNILYNYAFQDVGIVLTVTPRITANGYVTMDVTQTANDLQGYTDFNAPIVNQREASTVVSVKNGETIVLGGIIRSTVTATTNKVPILGDIPILGNLFKSTSKDKAKTELLVLLTPRIVHDEDEARQLRQDTTKQLSPESQKQLDKVIPPENTKKEIKDDKKGGGN